MARTQTPTHTTPPAAVRRRYVKIAEAAQYLDVTERTIRQMITDGWLRAYRGGNKRLVRLRLDEIDHAMEAGALTRPPKPRPQRSDRAGGAA